jgi:hypothetical protein
MNWLCVRTSVVADVDCVVDEHEPDRRQVNVRDEDLQQENADQSTIPGRHVLDRFLLLNNS